mgnify:CR=1 FL=1
MSTTMDEQTPSFSDVKDRLNEIADEVAREGISLDDALSLYEEAVKLGLGACDLSESDIFPEEIEEVEGIEEAATSETSDAPESVIIEEDSQDLQDTPNAEL